jgi:hypothetical protein
MSQLLVYVARLTLVSEKLPSIHGEQSISCYYEVQYCKAIHCLHPGIPDKYSFLNENKPKYHIIIHGLVAFIYVVVTKNVLRYIIIVETQINI